MKMENSLVKKSVLQVFKTHTGIMTVLFLAVCGVVTASLVPPQILKRIIDNNFVAKSNNGLLLMAVSYLGVLLLIGIFDFVKEAVLTVLGQKISKQIRMGMMEKLQKIDAVFFSTNNTGAVVSRFTNDVDAINTLFTSGIIGMLVDCLKIIGIIVSIWMFQAKLGLATLFILPVIYLITRLFQKKMLKAQIENRILVGKVNNHISESFKNIQMIKSFSKEYFMEKTYVKLLLQNFKTVEKVNFYDSIFSPVILIIRALVIGAIVILSSEQLNYFGISLGMVAASIELISNLFYPVESLGMELQSIQHAVSGIRRVNEFHMEKQDADKIKIDESITNYLYDNSREINNDKNKVKNIEKSNKRVLLNLDNVNFAYENGIDVLKNITLQINTQEKVTIIGRTGVGKTTLFKLLMGLIKPSSGNITLNGVEVNSIPNIEKRKVFGYVDQSFHRIKGTVAEQVSLKDNNITREKIEKAIDFVGLTDYVLSLENGYDTQMNNDLLFSQGQKQLLAIARAIVTDPPILLLDEITANLDSITENKIVSVLQKASYKHTIIAISHRLSSMIDSDTVVILEKGVIKNIGSPEALFQNDPWYRNHITMEKLTWD